MAAPGKHHRQGISLFELADMFPDEASARAYFERLKWPNGRTCPQCGSERTHEASHKHSPYRCTDCRSYFSVKTGGLMEGSKIPLRKWAFAIYLETTSLKGVSSMKLHRDLKVTQKTAWFMLHRIREAWARKQPRFKGPIEIDETYVGGREKNKHARKRLRAGRGSVGKAIVLGARDRATNAVTATVIKRADTLTLRRFVTSRAMFSSRVYTDMASAYKGMPYHHVAVNHSRGEYVNGDAHTNGIESFWATIKRAHKGVYHQLSHKHLQRYVTAFCGKHNDRNLDTVDQMASIVAGMEGKRLTYRQLIA